MDYLSLVQSYDGFKNVLNSLFNEEYLLDILFDIFNEHVCFIYNIPYITTKYKVKRLVIANIYNTTFLLQNEFSHVEELYIGGSNLDNLENIKNMKYLKMLDCNTNFITSLHVLENFNFLERLDYSNNKVNDNSILYTLPNLKYFNGINQNIYVKV